MCSFLRDGLRRGKVKLLLSENEGRESLKTKGFSDLTVESQTNLEMPYVQTTMLINEMINLEAEINDSGLIKLKEPKTKRKDRYSSVTYGNYIATELERFMFKAENNDDYHFFIYN